MKPRLLTISDPHGRFDALMQLLNFVKFDKEKDTLVLLGDLVDRGPKSSKIIDWVIQMQEEGADVRCLMGNHEYMFLAYMAGKYPEGEYFSKFIGGAATVESYSNYPEFRIIKHLQFIGKLPLYIEIDDYIFTHGGLNINKPLHEQNVNDTAWDESKFYLTKGIPGKTVIFGHYHTYYLYKDVNKQIVSSSRIWRDPVYKNKIGIDCGYINDKKLACLDLTNGLEYYYTIYPSKYEVLKVA